MADTWTKKMDMPTARTALAIGIVDEKIYAIGGTPAVQGPGLATVEIYDPVLDKWTPNVDMPTARVFLGADVVDGKIYAIGGVAEGLGPAILLTVEEFDVGGLPVDAKGKHPTSFGKIKTDD